MDDLLVQNTQLQSVFSELAKVEEQLRRQRLENGIDYFIPNSPQLKALRSNGKIVVYVGGNRVGKSTIGSVVLSAHLTRRYPKCDCHGEWFSLQKRFDRPIAAVIVVTEFAKVEQMLEKLLTSYLPKDWIKTLKRTPQGYIRRIVGKDEGTVDILTGEMDQQAFESTSWDFAWIDEPTSEGRYYAIQRGLLDRDGLTLLTFTPLIEPWMKQKLVDQADGRYIDCIQADTYENTEDIHGNPILTKESIRQLEDSLPEDLRATRIHGKFFHLRGLVYTEFTPSMHVKEFEYTYPDPVVGVIDPHDRLPHHMVWAWVDRNDWVHVDSELVAAATIPEFKKMILQHEQQKNYKMVKRLIDPNFGRKPLLTTGLTVIQEFEKNPFRVAFGEANDDKAAGHMKVKDALHWDRNKPLGLTNSPRLFFHQSRVPKTVRSIQNYQYDEWVGRTQEKRDPKEKERPKDNHGADCIRYLMMSNPNFDRLMGNELVMELEGSPY